jgi:uncharacterized protein involved in exopolysaccharide biosynthesis
MSRIDEAWKRMTGAAAEPHASSILEKFALEKAPRLDERNVSDFVSPGPRPVEARPPSSRQAPAVPTFATDQPMAASAPGQDEPNLEGPATADSERLIDFRQIADYAWFLIGAVRRHKVLAAGTFILVLAMTGGAVLFLPRTYHAQAKLLAQRNAVMAALSNPGRAIPWDADAPTRAAAETVLRRDNILTLIKQTNLMDEWERTRAPILKVKDALMALVRRRPTDDEKLDQLVGMLEARMSVIAGPVGDGTVTIDLDWPNAEMAYRLVESAQGLFLDARQAAETAAIGESIGILERYAQTLHQDINSTLAELQRTQPQRRPAQGAPRTAAARSLRSPLMPSIAATLPPVPAAALGSPALGADLDDPQIPRLKAAVALKRQEITALEDARQRQLSDVQTKLAQLTTVYTANHPSVVSAQQNLASLSRETPRVVALKADAEKLETEYLERVAAAQEILQEEQRRAEAAKQAAVVSAPEPAAGPREALTTPAEPTEPPSATGSDKGDYASVRLRLQLNQLESVLERTDGARIELAVSQAAFKYRYTVIRPAEVPKEPVSPNLQMVFMAGLIGSLLFAVAAAVGKDLMSGRIVEQWQIERQLGLRVLGSLRMA